MSNYDAICDFKLSECMKSLGLDEGGRVQKAIDNAFVQGCEPYVPFLTGSLKDSAMIHSKIGQGEIVYQADDAPKTRYLYYRGQDNWKWSNGGMQSGGLRGHHWADRFLQNGGVEFCRQAAIGAMK